MTLRSDHQLSELVINGGGVFDLDGHFLGLGKAGTPLTNGGVFNALGGTIVYNGVVAQTVATSNVDYDHLTIDNLAGVVLSEAEIVPGKLTLADGVFDIDSHLSLSAGALIVRATGSFSGTPTFGASVHVTYTGTVSVTTGTELPDDPAVLADLTIDNPGGVALSQDQTVNGVFTLASGVFDIDSRTLTLKGPVIAAGGALVSDPDGTVVYNQEADGQNVLAGDYGNLVFNDFSKILPADGVVRITGVFTPGSATNHTITGSTIEYGSAGTQNLPTGFATYNNLTLNNPAGTTGIPGLTVNGLLHVQDGTFTTASDFQDVSIDPGATLHAAGDITASGNWTNRGTFIPDTYTVTFDGSGSQVISGATDFYNLTVANTAATPDDAADVDSDAPLIVQNALNVSDGQFQPHTDSSFNQVSIGANGVLKPDNNGQLTINGDFTNDGSFVRNASTLIFGGTTTISGNSETVLHHAIVTGSLTAPAGFLNIAGDFTNRGTFVHGSGTLRFSGNRLQSLVLNVPTTFFNLTVANGTTLVETVATDNAIVANTLNNQGVIRKSSAVAGAGILSLGLTGVSINVTTPGGLSQIQVDRIDQSHPDGNVLTATDRYWTITPTGNAYTVDLTLLRPAAVTENALACRNGASEWNCSCSSTTATTITRSGVNVLSDWAVGTAATVVEVQDVAERWGESTGGVNYDILYDMDRNGMIDIRDIMLLSSLWNAGC